MDQKEYLPIRDVYCEITDNCNLKCPHCYRLDRNKKRDLPYDEVIKRFELAKELEAQNVFLTGGEPLLHKDIEKIIDAASSYDFNLVLLTNGTAKLPANIEKVNTVNVSMEFYGTKQDEFRGTKNLFNRACEFLDSLKGKVHRNVLTALFSENREDYEKLIEVAEQHADGIVFDRYVPHNPYPKPYAAENYKDVLKFFYEQAKLRNIDVKCYDPIFYVVYPELGLTRFRCKGRLFITTDEKYSLCPFYPKYYDTLEEALDERADEPLPEECLLCEHKESCHGGCPATRLCSYKTLTKKDSLCFINSK